MEKRSKAEVLNIGWDDIVLLFIVVLIILGWKTPENMALMLESGGLAVQSIFSVFAQALGMVHVAFAPIFSWLNGVVVGLFGLGTLAGFLIAAGFSVLAFL